MKENKIMLILIIHHKPVHTQPFYEQKNIYTQMLSKKHGMKKKKKKCR